MSDTIYNRDGLPEPRLTSEKPEPSVEVPRYFKVLYKQPPEHATPLWLISCDEGWRQSIVCEGMYEWAADWLLEQIQGKPFAPMTREKQDEAIRKAAKEGF